MNKIPRKRSNPSKKDEVEINICLKVVANPEVGSLDIRGFSIEPENELTIGEIAGLLGNVVATFIVNKTKAPSKIQA